jgi:hypothetical protein
LRSGEQFPQFGKAPEGGKASDGSEKRQWLLVDFGQLLQFHEIDPSLTGFIFRDQGLGLGEYVGDLSLGQSGIFSSLFQTL